MRALKIDSSLSSPHWRPCSVTARPCLAHSSPRRGSDFYTRLGYDALARLDGPSVTVPVDALIQPHDSRPPFIAGPGYAGDEFINRHVTYRVRVRMDDDGKLRTFYETAQPTYGVGQKVLITGRTILAAG